MECTDWMATSETVSSADYNFYLVSPGRLAISKLCNISQHCSYALWRSCFHKVNVRVLFVLKCGVVRINVMPSTVEQRNGDLGGLSSVQYGNMKLLGRTMACSNIMSFLNSCC